MKEHEMTRADDALVEKIADLIAFNHREHVAYPESPRATAQEIVAAVREHAAPGIEALLDAVHVREIELAWEYIGAGGADDGNPSSWEWRARLLTYSGPGYVEDLAEGTGPTIEAAIRAALAAAQEES